MDAIHGYFFFPRLCEEHRPAVNPEKKTCKLWRSGVSVVQLFFFCNLVLQESLK